MMIPPTPAIPRFADNSLLLDTTPDFGDDMTLGDILEPPTPVSKHDPTFPCRQSTLSTPIHSQRLLKELDVSQPRQMASEDVFTQDNVPEQTVLVGRGERTGESSASGFARSIARTASPRVSATPRSDDFYARRLSTSRPSSPFISSSVLPSNVIIPSHTGQSRPITTTRFPRSSSVSSTLTIETSDEEPSRVHLAWRSRPINASKQMSGGTASAKIAQNGGIQNPSSHLPVPKPKTSALGRYLAKAAILKPEPTTAPTLPVSTDSSNIPSTPAIPEPSLVDSRAPPSVSTASTATTLTSVASSGSSVESSSATREVSPEGPIRAEEAESSPVKDVDQLRPADEPILSTARISIPVEETVSQRSERTLPSIPSLLPDSPETPLSEPAPIETMDTLPKVKPATPPALPLSEAMGTATTPFGIPIPTLVDFDDDDDDSQRVGYSEDEDDYEDNKGAAVSKGKAELTRSRSGLVDFFTDFLRGSTSSRPTIQEIIGSTTDKECSGPVQSRGLVREEDMSKATTAVDSSKLGDGKDAERSRPQNKIAVSRRPIPGYIPLTRPSHPKPVSTVATAARALQPSKTLPSATNNIARPRPLAHKVSAQSKTVPMADKPLRKPPLPSFQRPTTSSAFAKAALAKLPPPGRGSTSASKPVKVRTPERAHNLASRRRVFESDSAKPPLPSIKPGQVTSPKRKIVKTVPVTGKTPGKASRARAMERTQFDEALKKRNEQREMQRREMAKKREEEEEEEYLKRRKETVIWAKPVPEIYRQANEQGA